MVRGLLLALCVASVPAAAADKPVVHFAEVGLDQLWVMQLIELDALVEGPGGEVALVRTGDLLGKEQARVVKVKGGCVALKVGRSAVTLCADAPAAPRS